MGIYQVILYIVFLSFVIIIIIIDLNKATNFDNESYQVFGKTEKEIAVILTAFLKFKKFNESMYIEIIKEIFENYSEKMFIIIPNNFLNFMVDEFTRSEININNSCYYLSKKPAKFRLFVLYNLMDIAAFDKVYSIEEDEFINNIRQKIKIPVQTFKIIKNNYTKKGVKDERKIIEEQNRKKQAKSFSKYFLPYNAYKILGVSPSVTKAQLKKAYRTLAKKYHPDKFHGQSEEIIQKAEDKFQEILDAYEIIKIHKNLN